jgi:hypothetical protein
MIKTGYVRFLLFVIFASLYRNMKGLLWVSVLFLEFLEFSFGGEEKRRFNHEKKFLRNNPFFIYYFRLRFHYFQGIEKECVK